MKLKKSKKQKKNIFSEEHLLVAASVGISLDSLESCLKKWTGVSRS